jgi:hypothetical protein
VLDWSTLPKEYQYGNITLRPNRADLRTDGLEHSLIGLSSVTPALS